MLGFRRLRLGSQSGVLALVMGVQIPVLIAASALDVFVFLPLLAFGLLVTLPFVGQVLRSPWDHRPRSAVHKYLVMWPFYSWWTFCLIFGLAALPLYVAAAVTRLTAIQAFAAAALVAVVGTIRALRPRPHVARRDLVLPLLPPAFHGLRIVQLSDVHCGPFTSERQVRQWVERANRLKPDLIAITGDLITTGPDYIDRMARALGDLKAPMGVYACLGNHDYFGTGGKVGPALQAAGIRVLNNEGLTLRRAEACVYLAGIDDNWSGRDDLARALRQRPAGMPTILLAHDPGMFPKAAAARVDLVLSGHTHGGQFAVPWMVRRLNLARLMTPFSSGVYRAKNAVLYVSHGLGTSGPPIRLGARPELGLLTLQQPAVSEPAAVQVVESRRPTSQYKQAYSSAS